MQFIEYYLKIHAQKIPKHASNSFTVTPRIVLPISNSPMNKDYRYM